MIIDRTQARRVNRSEANVEEEENGKQYIVGEYIEHRHTCTTIRNMLERLVAVIVR